MKRFTDFIQRVTAPAHTAWAALRRRPAPAELPEATSYVSMLAHTGGALAGVLLVVSGWLYFGVYQPSAFFPLRTVLTIPEGATITEVGDILKQEQAVRSSWAFRFAVAALGRGTQVVAGDYYFDHRLTLVEVARRVTKGEYGLEPVKVVVPEGATTYQMADIFEEHFPKFDATTFLLLAKDKEGYLFPDTYLFLPNVTASQILDALERTFYERIRTLEENIAAFGKPIHEVVTMASLLEKEAWDHEERREIAGVLWHRLDIGMPLQVDAVFGYIEGRETFSPKFSDLDTESPYNTYRNKGLPPGPIGSPSLSAIDAAVRPIETNALFYLHGRDGVLRLAKTYDEHLVNRRRYLD